MNLLSTLNILLYDLFNLFAVPKGALHFRKIRKQIKRQIHKSWFECLVGVVLSVNRKVFILRNGHIVYKCFAVLTLKKWYFMNKR